MLQSSLHTSAVGDHIGLVVGVKENLLPVGSINEVVRRRPHDLHDAQQLLNLILACKGHGAGAGAETSSVRHCCR